MKSKSTTVILSFFGLHYFYLGKIGTGILYLFTFGGFLWWWIIDIFRFISMSEQEFNLLYNSTIHPVEGCINNQNNNTIDISNEGLSKVFMLSTGKIIKVPVYMENRDGLLYNLNTHRYEALEGDWGAVMEEYGKPKEGEIEGYTDFQCVKFKGLPGIIMSAEPARNGALRITHKTTISYEIED